MQLLAGSHPQSLRYPTQDADRGQYRSPIVHGLKHVGCERFEPPVEGGDGRIVCPKPGIGVLDDLEGCLPLQGLCTAAASNQRTAPYVLKKLGRPTVPCTMPEEHDFGASAPTLCAALEQEHGFMSQQVLAEQRTTGSAAGSDSSGPLLLLCARA